MTTTISRGPVPPETEPQFVYPDLVLGWDVTRTGGSIKNKIVGGGMSITLQQPNPRSGTLRLFFRTEAEAVVAFNLHAPASMFSFIADDSAPSWKDMSYVVDDAGCRIVRDEETRTRWIVEVAFQELQTA